MAPDSVHDEGHHTVADCAGVDAPRSRSTIWSIQVLRFAAALMVVYIHATVIAGGVTGSSGFIPFRVANIGHIGVDIFFVISGLIIAKIAPGRTPSDTKSLKL